MRRAACAWQNVLAEKMTHTAAMRANAALRGERIEGISPPWSSCGLSLTVCREEVQKPFTRFRFRCTSVMLFKPAITNRNRLRATGKKHNYHSLTPVGGNGCAIGG